MASGSSNQQVCGLVTRSPWKRLQRAVTKFIPARSQSSRGRRELPPPAPPARQQMVCEDIQDLPLGVTTASLALSDADYSQSFHNREVSSGPVAVNLSNISCDSQCDSRLQATCLSLGPLNSTVSYPQSSTKNWAQGEPLCADILEEDSSLLGDRPQPVGSEQPEPQPAPSLKSIISSTVAAILDLDLSVTEDSEPAMDTSVLSECSHDCSLCQQCTPVRPARRCSESSESAYGSWEDVSSAGATAADSCDCSSCGVGEVGEAVCDSTLDSDCTDFMQHPLCRRPVTGPATTPRITSLLRKKVRQARRRMNTDAFHTLAVV